MNQERSKRIVDRLLDDAEEYGGRAWADLWRLWKDHLRPYRFRLIAAFIVAAGLGGLGLTFPLNNRFLVDPVLRLN